MVANGMISTGDITHVKKTLVLTMKDIKTQLDNSLKNINDDRQASDHKERMEQLVSSHNEYRDEINAQHATHKMQHETFQLLISSITLVSLMCGITKLLRS